MSDGIVYGFGLDTWCSPPERRLVRMNVRPGHVGDVASEKSLEYIIAPLQCWRFLREDAIGRQAELPSQLPRFLPRAFDIVHRSS